MDSVEPAEQTVLGIARGYQLSQALYVAAKLGLADVLDPQPLAAEAIARAVGARASQLRRVLRALVAAGVFCELEDGRFASNDAAAPRERRRSRASPTKVRHRSGRGTVARALGQSCSGWPIRNQTLVLPSSTPQSFASWSTIRRPQPPCAPGVGVGASATLP